MTLFFSVTTAVCLIVLAFFAARADADVRERTDAGLVAQAKLFSSGVKVQGSGFNFDYGTSTSIAGLAAIGSVPAGFVDARGIALAYPSQNALPASSVIDQLYDSMHETQGAVFATAAGTGGRSYRWVARPIDRPASAMILVGTPSTSSFSHTTLVAGLFCGVTLLVLLASAAGHALSGRAMRPALRQVEQQEQFLREAAHEIRTPLTTLTLIAESGLRKPATAEDSLQAILDRLTRMNAVVGSLLVRARAQTPGFEIDKRPLRLDQLVDVTIGDLELEGRIVMGVSPTVVNGNADLIAQAVRNLVDNAIRHGHGHGEVQVTVANRSFTVANAGKGEIGEPFGGPDGSRSTAGTGTGLSIVAWVAEVHSAEFTTTESAWGGRTAVFTFPRAGTSGP